MSHERPYHHGDLRRAILDAAVEAIRADGPAALSLRGLARRAGVSHAAPAHHFTDRAGLLTAIAADGYRTLADTLAPADTPPADLHELGVRYVRFATGHPAYFEVMFRPGLLHDDDPDLRDARDRARTLLREAVDRMPEPRRGTDAGLAVVAAWSLAHGMATLWLAGNLAAALGDRDPADAFADVARLLFA